MSTGSLDLRCLIVDDEAPARRLLREYLETLGDVEVVGECANGFEAVKAVAELAPDLIVLDVQMPKLSGFEVLELLGVEPPPVIFVTAYDEYALRAFEVHAVDYLLKPYSPERLAAAVCRFRQGWRARASGAELRRSASGAGIAPAERVLIREGSDIHVVPVERIDYVEAQDDYVSLQVGERRLRKQQTMSQLEAELDPGRFVRIHRSYLLNVDRLARLELYAKDSRVAILRDGSRLPVSRAGYGRLRERL